MKRKKAAIPKQSRHVINPARLRRRAEARLAARRRSQPSTPGPASEADTRRALYELEVHQIELEMQNSELMQVRKDLETALEKYTDLYDFAPVGYLTLDPDGAIRQANLAGARLLGITPSILLNQRFGLFVSAFDSSVFDDFLQNVFDSNAQQSCELTLKLVDRPPLEVSLEASVLESGLACRMTLTDITERRRAETDRLIVSKLEATGILAGGIAHDFNNLLTVILLNLDLARDLRRPAEALSHLEEAKQSSLVAQDLTAQLVTFAGTEEPVRKATLLSEVIEDSVPPIVAGSNVRCDFSLPNDLWPAEVDARQIGQVIRNIVLNSREAMPQGGTVLIRAENVALSPEEKPPLRAGKYVHLSIEDRGSGISKSVVAKIFDPYFSTKPRGSQKGMGLGLTICHTIVQKHGGMIGVVSGLSDGSTFHVWLPATKFPSGANEHRRSGANSSTALERSSS